MRLILGFICGVLVIPALVYTGVRLGYAPVATAAQPLPLERWLAKTALKARVRGEAPGASPLTAKVENLVAGAKLYQQHCAFCHGLPDQAASPAAKGMFPRPPQLFHGHGVTDDPIGETYWKVANGIRLTGMPGYQKTLREDQMWQISLLLAHANELPPEVFAILRHSAAD